MLLLLGFLGAALSGGVLLRVRLLLLDRVVNVLDEGVDVAVRIAHLPDSALVATAVGATRRMACASPAYLARHGKPSEPRALAAHRCIGFTALTPTETWTFAPGPEGGRSKQVKVEPVLAVNTAEAAIASAIAGQGVTCALSYQIAAPLRAQTLTAILTPYEPPPLPVHLVSTARAVTSAKVRAFVDLATPALRAGRRAPSVACEKAIVMRTVRVGGCENCSRRDGSRAANVTPPVASERGGARRLRVCRPIALGAHRMSATS